MYMSEVEVYVVLHLGPVLQEEADLCWEVDRDFAGGRFGVLIHVRVEKEETGAFITARKLRGVVSEAVPLGRGEGGEEGHGQLTTSVPVSSSATQPKTSCGYSQRRRFLRQSSHDGISRVQRLFCFRQVWHATRAKSMVLMLMVVGVLPTPEDDLFRNFSRIRSFVLFCCPLFPQCYASATDGSW